MSQGKRARKKQYPIRTLVFDSPTRLINFLLSAVDEPDFGPGSVIYEKCLNRIYRQRPSGLLIRVQAHDSVVERLEAMVQAGVARASIHEGDQVTAGSSPLSIEQLMRRVHLREEPQTRYQGGQLLTALWGADQDSLSEYVSYLWDLGASGMEIAFVRSSATDEMPSHIVRIQGLRHPGAFQSWGQRSGVTAELFVPMSGAHQASQYYVQWGWRYPVPGLDRLVSSDSELTLLRRPEGQDSTEWRAFRSGDIHFFQKPNELLELEIARESRSLIEMQADARDRNVPLEVAIVPRSRSALREYWQIDREIDRLRRSLRDLEQNRARLVGRDGDEVFFAYRFNQEGHSDLNPLMLRLLQQRMGTLTGYDHAFCKPENATPFHLVMANRPSRALGFSMQVADRVYYQPRQWRNWGVNLYLPLDTELAPLIDSSDAIPLLQRILEHTSQFPDGELDSGEGDYREWDAILWEPSQAAGITETRVKDKQPLLSRFRLLNSFQCRVARDVEQKTRERLAETLRATRAEVTDELDQLETELLEAVATRTAEVEKQFAEMQEQLTRAEGLVEQLEPKVQTVSERLLKAPENWVEFVRTVLKTHAAVIDPPLEAFQELRTTLKKVETALLKTLTPRAKDLVEAAQRESDRLDSRFDSFDAQRTAAMKGVENLEKLSSRIGAVLVEAAGTFRQIERRVRKVEQLEQEIREKQQVIDRIDEKERDANARHEVVTRLHAEADSRAAEADRKMKEVRESEQALTAQVAELGQLQIQLNEQEQLLSARLAQLARDIATAREQDEEMKALSTELKSRIGFVNSHSKAVETWEHYRNSWQTRLDVRWREQTQRIESMTDLVRTLRERTTQLEQSDGQIDQLEAELQRLESSLTELHGRQAQIAGKSTTDGDS